MIWELKTECQCSRTQIGFKCVVPSHDKSARNKDRLATGIINPDDGGNSRGKHTTHAVSHKLLHSPGKQNLHDTNDTCREEGDAGPCKTEILEDGRRIVENSIDLENNTQMMR